MGFGVGGVGQCCGHIGFLILCLPVISVIVREMRKRLDEGSGTIVVLVISGGAVAAADDESIL